MKIKVKPEDFIVREKSLIVLSPRPAAYRVYLLKKTRWDSFALLDFLARRMRVPKTDLSLGGHKDRHGTSEQLLTVKNRDGLPDGLEGKNYSLRHRGYLTAKLTAAGQAGNNFRVTLRDLTSGEAALAARNHSETAAWGFPNYYDAQRFGSARAGKGFLGKALFLGRMEEALKIFFAPDGHEKAEEREWKKQAASLWRQWKKIEAPVPKKYEPVMRVLLAPGGYMAFKQAVNAIDRDLLILSLHAYQSFLFNRLTVHYLSALENKGEVGPLATVPFPYGDLLFYRALDAPTLARLLPRPLPVPGHDTETDDPLAREALERVLVEEGITLADLKVKKLPGKAVRGVSRALIVLPEEFKRHDPEDDELFPGQKKMTLEFFLTRGSYATMLFKRLFLGAE